MQSLKTYNFFPGNIFGHKNMVVCEGFRLFLVFRKTADKKDELFHMYFSRILRIV